MGQRSFCHNKVREMYSSGEWTQTELARYFDVARPTITKIVNYRLPKWVNEELDRILNPKTPVDEVIQ